jgi:ankyrin repeat domain-containing protein 50
VAKRQDDLSKYITYKVESPAKSNHYSKRLENDVCAVLQAKSQGTFLWASLVIDQLSKAKHDDRSVRKILKTLPRDLHEIYDRILSQVDRSDVDVAKFVLQWVTIAWRSLTVDELDTAYYLWTVKQTGSEVQEIEKRRDIYQYCGPFVYRDDAHQTVNLVHQSAKDYLLSDDDHFSLTILLLP